ncbi:hypothetical protein JVU11DRAFT_2520 [Chiua virens]|nr:hypothetical protein JVU11DRAFT_2520 [Chiua virens]
MAEEDGAVVPESVSIVSMAASTTETTDETEDQRALRAILAGEDVSAPAVDALPVSESDALKRDVQELSRCCGGRL